MALNNIEIAQINHREHFIRSVLNPCYNELKNRLQRLLNETLLCTDQLRPLNLTAYKGTMKHDCNQMTVIRTPVLKNGTLFQRFFFTFPEVHSHKGFNISQLILQVCSEGLNLSYEDLRQRISGACFDGQYINLNVKKYFSDSLHLPIDFMEDIIIWDAAHRLELVCDDVKNGKQDLKGNCIFNPTSWLQDLDGVLQFIMTKFTTGENHSHLRSITQEMGDTSLEFCLFL